MDLRNFLRRFGFREIPEKVLARCETWAGREGG